MPDPTVTTPESHWNHADPEAQPPRDLVIGVGRMVQETRARLGLAADEGAVLADIKSRGLDVSVQQVRQFWSASE